MNTIDRYLAYAAAFGVAYDSDDWSVIEPFFTGDAVLEVFGEPPFAARHEGRVAVLAYFKEVLDGFDRRFSAKRTVGQLEGPLERDGGVWIHWQATYPLTGAPDLVLEGIEQAFFDGERIRRLEDHIPDLVTKRTGEYLAVHGARLGMTG